MPTVVIQTVVQGPVAEAPFSSHGNVINVTAWLVNALVDGLPVQNIKLRAFSPKVHWLVRPGGTAVCDPPKMHNNQVEYKITTPSDANGKVNEMQAQQPAYSPPQQSLMPPVTPQTPPAWAQPTQTQVPARTSATQPAQRPPWTPPPSYTREEYEDILMQGLKFAREMFDKKTDAAVIASFAATYVIGATELGIKMPNTRQAPKQEAVPEVDAMWDCIYGGGLGERMKNCNIPEATLLTWYNQAGKDANAFKIRCNYEMKQIEAGAKKDDDNMPF